VKPADRKVARAGVLSAVGAYALWGVLPVYWKLLRSVDAPQILAHRILWSFAFLLGVIFLRGEWKKVRSEATAPRLRLYAVAALLLGINWLTYIWAVNAGNIVETSLGYYINPLVSVMLATTFLRERLRPIQWAAVVLAAAGVAYLTFRHGRLPWVALVLAATFGSYGLIKKLAPLGALHGLTLETGTLAVPAAAYLTWIHLAGSGMLGGGGGWTVSVLLVLAGLVTSLPLLLFARAAQSVRLATLGLLQYIAPSLALLLGVFVYGEPFGKDRAVGFIVIWSALALYWIDGVWALGRVPLTAPQERERA
jgi:chloramphenicol-sensitive protein RarD